MELLQRQHVPVAAGPAEPLCSASLTGCKFIPLPPIPTPPGFRSAAWSCAELQRGSNCPGSGAVVGRAHTGETAGI